VQSIEPTCGREFEYEDEFEYDYGNDCEEGGLSPRTRISPVSTEIQNNLYIKRLSIEDFARSEPYSTMSGLIVPSQIVLVCLIVLVLELVLVLGL